MDPIHDHYVLLIILFLLMSNVSRCAFTYDDDVTQYVDIVRGIEPAYSGFSYGNVLPFVALPRATAKWTYTTFETLDDAWFVKPQMSEFFGFRYSNQPSPWMNDYGQFVVRLHKTGLLKYSKMKPVTFGINISESIRPHMMSVDLKDLCTQHGCVTMRLAPTEYGAVIEIETPPSLDEKLSLDFDIFSGTGEVRFTDSKLFHGKTNRQARRHSDHFEHFFCAEILSKVELKPIFQQTLSWRSDPNGSKIRINIGTSYIDQEQACFNMKLAQNANSWSELAQSNKERWNSVLRRVQIPKESSLYDKQNLYTALYRGLLFPQDLSEINQQGNRVHYSPYTARRQTLPGRVATATGFWDAYRALYPMVDLVFPDFAVEIFEGWVNAMRECGGTVPEWPCPGNGDMMEGSMSDVSMAEAIVKGLIKKEDIEDVYESMKTNAFRPWKTRARKRLSDYLRLGYVPLKVSATLNYMLADASIAKVAALLGDRENSLILQKRASSWDNVFDNGKLFFRSKAENRKFFGSSSFSEHEQKTWEQGGYMEGGPWQYRFYVPYDPAGLREAYAHASRQSYDTMRMCNKLLETMTTSSNYYSTDMHEAKEMGKTMWGQYAHNNQPVHHILYMFTHAGCAIEGQLYIQHTLAVAYGPFGFPGDEDNGEMASWYVLSSLGLYALDPASGDYQVGAPVLFNEMTIRFPDGKVLRVTKAPDLPTRIISVKSKEYQYPYANAISWNGVESSLLEPVTISYATLRAGGHLHFYNSDGAAQKVSMDEDMGANASTNVFKKQLRGFQLDFPKRQYASSGVWDFGNYNFGSSNIKGYFAPFRSFAVGWIVGAALYTLRVGRLGLAGLLFGCFFGMIVYIIFLGASYLPSLYSESDMKLKRKLILNSS